MKRQAERRRDAIRLSLGGNTNQSPPHALTRSPSFRTQWIGRRGRLANLGVSRFIRRFPNRDHYTTIVLNNNSLCFIIRQSYYIEEQVIPSMKQPGFTRADIKQGPASRQFKTTSVICVKQPSPGFVNC